MTSERDEAHDEPVVLKDEAHDETFDLRGHGFIRTANRHFSQGNDLMAGGGAKHA
jgi:hypothetical protein